MNATELQAIFKQEKLDPNGIRMWWFEPRPGLDPACVTVWGRGAGCPLLKGDGLPFDEARLFWPDVHLHVVDGADLPYKRWEFTGACEGAVITQALLRRPKDLKRFGLTRAYPDGFGADLWLIERIENGRLVAWHLREERPCP